MGKGQRLRQERRNAPKKAATATQPRNFDGWAEKGWHTPDDPDVIHIAVGNCFDFLPTMPDEIQDYICRWGKYLDEMMATPGITPKMIGGTLLKIFEYAKLDYKSLTAFAILSNWNMWEQYGRNEPLARIYNDFYLLASKYAYEFLEGEEASYYYKWTD